MKSMNNVQRKKHGGFDMEDFVTQEKRSNGYYIWRIDIMPIAIYIDNPKEEVVKKIDDINEKLDLFNTKNNNEWFDGTFNCYEYHDWMLYSRPEKIMPLPHGHITVISKKEKKYRLSFWRQLCKKLKINGVIISGWHPGYPGYNIAYIQKNWMYSEPWIICMSTPIDGMKQIIKYYMEKYQDYPLQQRIVDDEYNNAADDTNTLTTVNGFVIFCLRNIFYQQGLKWTIDDNHEYKKMCKPNMIDDFKNVMVGRKDWEPDCYYVRWMDFFDDLISENHKYDYFCRTYKKQIKKVLSTSQIMAEEFDYFREK